jgi:hypothetical protein
MTSAPNSERLSSTNHLTSSPPAARPATLSPSTWKDIWIKKFKKTLHDQGMADRDATWNTTVDRYLVQNPYPPAKIFVNLLKSFLQEFKE